MSLEWGVVQLSVRDTALPYRAAARVRSACAPLPPQSRQSRQLRPMHCSSSNSTTSTRPPRDHAGSGHLLISLYGGIPRVKYDIRSFYMYKA